MIEDGKMYEYYVNEYYVIEYCGLYLHNHVNLFIYDIEVVREFETLNDAKKWSEKNKDKYEELPFMFTFLKVTVEIAYENGEITDYRREYEEVI